MNHNLDWSKLRCGIDMEEFIALCVYCTYDASRSSGAQARVNLEGNIQNKYKERIRGLRIYSYVGACKTSPISADIFKLSERSILMLQSVGTM